MQIEIISPNELARVSSVGDTATERGATESARGRYVFAALLLLVALTAIPYGAAAPWWESVFECSVFILGVVWTCGAAWRGESVLKGDTLLYPVLALLALACVQALPLPRFVSDTGGAASAIAEQAANAAGAARYLSADVFETRRFVLKLLALVVTGMLLRACVRGKESRLRALVGVVVGVGLASALFALLRHATQEQGNAFVLPLLQPETGYGQFINHNHFAYLAEMTLGLLLGISTGGVRRERLPLCFAAGACVWTALVLSNSRGGIFSMLGQLFFFIALWPRLLSRRGWRDAVSEHRRNSGVARGKRPVTPRAVLMRVGPGACLLAVAILGVNWVGGDALAGRMDELPREVRAASEANPRLRVRRAEMWEAAWQLFKSNPVLGIGFGGFADAVTEQYDASGNWTLQEAHNDYLELLASGGLIGAALALWFVAALVREARKQLRARDAFGRAACRGALVGLCGVALHSLVDFGLHLTVNAFVCVALVVIATARVGEADGAASESTRGTANQHAN